jgi:hypothetical protein
MSFAAHSVLLSSTLSDTQMFLVAASIGLSDTTTVRSTLADRQMELVSTHETANPLHSVFDRIENLPRPALIALGAQHGMQLG